MADPGTPPFPLPATPREAIRLQEELRSRVQLACRFPWKGIRAVAGADCSFEWQGNSGAAAVTVLSFPDLGMVDRAVVRGHASFPYIPGLLSFREIPLVLAAWERLRVVPDVLLCDGQGIAHPRGIGLASHLGLFLGMPTVGVAKSRLVGEHRELGPARGDQVPLVYQGRRVGTVLRSRARVKPLYVSPGHRIGFKDSVRLVLECCPRYRLPETTRTSHVLVNRVRRFGEEALDPAPAMG